MIGPEDFVIGGQERNIESRRTLATAPSVCSSLNQAVNREETDSDRLYQTNETNEREHVTFSRRKRHIHILRLCVRGGMTARPRSYPAPFVTSKPSRFGEAKALERN